MVFQLMASKCLARFILNAFVAICITVAFAVLDWIGIPSSALAAPISSLTVSTPAPSPDPQPSLTFEPTLEPTLEPTVEPSSEATEEATVEQTPEPILEPTPEAIFAPTVEPTLEPTVDPTSEPIIGPTIEPPLESAEGPTPRPSSTPTPVPNPTATPVATPTPAPTPPPVTCCFCLSWGRDFGNHCRGFEFPNDCTRSQRYQNVRTEPPALPPNMLTQIGDWRCQNVRVAYYHHGNPPMCTTYFNQARACMSVIRKNNATGSVALISTSCSIFGNTSLVMREIQRLRDDCPAGFECRVAAHVTLGILPNRPGNFSFTDPDGCNVPYQTVIVSRPQGNAAPPTAQLCIPFCETWVGTRCRVNNLGVPCMPQNADANTRPRLMRCQLGSWRDAGEFRPPAQ